MMDNPTPSKILVRPFEDKDATHVRRLFVLGHTEGAVDAPNDVALRLHLTAPATLLNYGVVALGTGMGLLGCCTRRRTGLGGLALSTAGFLLAGLATSYWRVSRRCVRTFFTGYTTQTIETGDMRDVGNYYMGYTREGYTGHHDEDRRKHSMMWVAEEVSTGEVVGCIALDATSRNDPRELELRRMSVSPNHRRRGIGRMLVQTLRDHAASLNAAAPRSQRFTRVVLETTVYQSGAIAMYQKCGWKKTRVLELPETQPWIEGMGVTFTGLVQELVLDLD